MRPSLPPRFLILLTLLPFSVSVLSASSSGERLATPASGVTLWWTLSSSSKIRPDTPPPEVEGKRVLLQCARNETEAAQLVLRTTKPLSGFRIECEPLSGPGGVAFPANRLEVMQAAYLNIARATDAKSKAGLWPDPLLPFDKPTDLATETNHAFWLRAFVPKQTPPGSYTGKIHLQAEGFSSDVPLELVVFDFELPDTMTCQTAFGFSAGEVFRYHGLKTDEQKRAVLDNYLSNLAAHHVSPYDPAPLDPIQVRWPEVKPPRSSWDDWTGLRIVTNEVHSGGGALLVNDDQPAANVTVTYEPLIPLPAKGLRFHGWFRTPIAGQRFNISFNHHDANKQWMSGRNNDLVIAGTGRWQEINEALTQFPEGAAYLGLHVRATAWTESGENLGLLWADDLSLKETETGREWLTGGDFERKPRTELVASAEQLKAKLDFTKWDAAVQKAIDTYHFNSFRFDFPGLGGGTFHSIEGPSLLGFHEQDPEYPLLMGSYGSQVEAHLRERGWLDEAFVYWFDEPEPSQYAFVMNGFAKLKRYAPGLTRMLTEQVEPGLIGGPNLWCPISNEYRHERAEERRKAGERFWWYVCTGPKAPYAGLFIDHPAPEMRIWVWQTWQRGINGLLVWEMNYWTSSAAYPDRDKPQNPYDDPMSWTSGYSTPAGQRLPWGNGDGRFIYPPPGAAGANPSAPVMEGPVDSIRWEQLRDGIEDYEYFQILKQRLQKAEGRLSSAEAQQFRALLSVPEAVTRSMTEFTPDGAPIEAHRVLLARAIERLGQIAK